jgi:PAS domain-containing protein
LTGEAEFSEQFGVNSSDDLEPEGDLQGRVAESSVTGSRFWQISPDLLGVLKANGYFGSCNPAWTAVLGWTEDEIRRPLTRSAIAGSCLGPQGRKLFEDFLRKVNKLQAQQQLEAQARTVENRGGDRGR